jgi:hypothetical protein
MAPGVAECTIGKALPAIASMLCDARRKVLP